MKAIAQKPSSRETHKAKRFGNKNGIHSTMRSVSAFPGAQPIIQRKPGCPCGGGCPRCKEEAPIQTKLKIGEPNDKYEREADRVAEQVMRLPDSKEKPDHIPQVHSETAANIAALRGSGQPLSRPDLDFFEPRLGHDFSQVRVHTDARAAETARAVNARAFTVGRDVMFGAGQYAPETREGRQLLGHELTHVVQQQGMGASSLQRLTEGKKAEDLLSLKYARNPRLERAFDNDPPLRIGESGEAVRLVQEGLVADGFEMPASMKQHTCELDGIYGQETFRAVQKFQRKYKDDGLLDPRRRADGIVGRKTLGKLDELAQGGQDLPETPADVAGSSSFAARPDQVLEAFAPAPTLSVSFPRIGPCELPVKPVPPIPVPQVQTGVFVEPASAAEEFRKLFEFLCSEGNFGLAGNRITSNCPGSAFSKNSCSCLCQATKSTKRRFSIIVRPVSNNSKTVELHDGQVVEKIPTPSVTPVTRGDRENPNITMPESTDAGPGAINFGGFNFGYFSRSGDCIVSAKWQLFVHEFCGHGVLKQRSQNAKIFGCRPAHDETIITENAIAKDVAGAGSARGTFETARQGESFVKFGSQGALLFTLADGRYFEDCQPVKRASNFKKCQ